MIASSAKDLQRLARSQNRRCLRPVAGMWNERTDRLYDQVVSPFLSIVPHAERYRENNPRGVVVQEFNPMLCLYQFDHADPFDRGGWWIAYGDPKNPLSPDALLRYYVMQNRKAGVDLLWPHMEDPSVPVGPVNPSYAMGRWLPAEGEDGWTCPRAVWNETAGLTFPQVAALALAKCLQNPRYREAINGGFYLDDMPGLNHPWSTWDSQRGGLPRYGDGGLWDTYHSPIVDGTHAFFAKLEELGVLEMMDYRINAYGNSPSRGNFGQWRKDPIGGKLETYHEQMKRTRENDLDHFALYFEVNRRDQPAWPEWDLGYRFWHEKVGSAETTVHIGRVGAGDPGHWRRWALGAALLLNGTVALNRSHSDYDVPDARECPEYWEWTEGLYPTSGAELRELRDGAKVWLRAYAKHFQPRAKHLLVVNPGRSAAAASVPPEDAVMLDLLRMPWPEVMRFHAELGGLEVNAPLEAQPPEIGLTEEGNP